MILPIRSTDGMGSRFPKRSSELLLLTNIELLKTSTISLFLALG